MAPPMMAPMLSPPLEAGADGEAAIDTAGEVAGDAAGEVAGDAAGEVAGDAAGDVAGDVGLQSSLQRGALQKKVSQKLPPARNEWCAMVRERMQPGAEADRSKGGDILPRTLVAEKLVLSRQGSARSGGALLAACRDGQRQSHEGANARREQHG